MSARNRRPDNPVHTPLPSFQNLSLSSLPSRAVEVGVGAQGDSNGSSSTGKRRADDRDESEETGPSEEQLQSVTNTTIDILGALNSMLEESTIGEAVRSSEIMLMAQPDLREPIPNETWAEGGSEPRQRQLLFQRAANKAREPNTNCCPDESSVFRVLQSFKSHANAAMIDLPSNDVPEISDTGADTLKDSIKKGREKMNDIVATVKRTSRDPGSSPNGVELGEITDEDLSTFQKRCSQILLFGRVYNVPSPARRVFIDTMDSLIDSENTGLPVMELLWRHFMVLFTLTRESLSTVNGNAFNGLFTDKTGVPGKKRTMFLDIIEDLKASRSGPANGRLAAEYWKELRSIFLRGPNAEDPVGSNDFGEASRFDTERVNEPNIDIYMQDYGRLKEEWNQGSPEKSMEKEIEVKAMYIRIVMRVAKYDKWSWFANSYLNLCLAQCLQKRLSIQPTQAAEASRQNLAAGFEASLRQEMGASPAEAAAIVNIVTNSGIEAETTDSQQTAVVLQGLIDRAREDTTLDNTGSRSPVEEEIVDSLEDGANYEMEEAGYQRGEEEEEEEEAEEDEAEEEEAEEEEAEEEEAEEEDEDEAVTDELEAAPSTSSLVLATGIVSGFTETMTRLTRSMQSADDEEAPELQSTERATPLPSVAESVAAARDTEQVQLNRRHEQITQIFEQELQDLKNKYRSVNAQKDKLAQALDKSSGIVKKATQRITNLVTDANQKDQTIEGLQDSIDQKVEELADLKEKMQNLSTKYAKKREELEAKMDENNQKGATKSQAENSPQKKSTTEKIEELKQSTKQFLKFLRKSWGGSDEAEAVLAGVEFLLKSATKAAEIVQKFNKFVADNLWERMVTAWKAATGRDAAGNYADDTDFIARAFGLVLDLRVVIALRHSFSLGTASGLAGIGFFTVYHWVQINKAEDEAKKNPTIKPDSKAPWMKYLWAITPALYVLNAPQVTYGILKKLLVQLTFPLLTAFNLVEYINPVFGNASLSILALAGTVLGNRGYGKAILKVLTDSVGQVAVLGTALQQVSSAMQSTFANVALSGATTVLQAVDLYYIANSTTIPNGLGTSLQWVLQTAARLGMKPIEFLMRNASIGGFGKVVLAMTLAVVILNYSYIKYNKYKNRRLEQSAGRVLMLQDGTENQNALQALQNLSGSTAGPEAVGDTNGRESGDEDDDDVLDSLGEVAMEAVMHSELDKMVDMNISDKELGVFVIVPRSSRRRSPNVCSYLAVVTHTDVWQKSRLSALSNHATSHSNKVAELILSSCKLSDPTSHISSVLRDSEGRTVVRVRADPRNNPLVLLKALQKLWPLAKSSVHENALDGTVEAEIVVPRQKDEQRRARLRAKRSRFSEFLLVLSGVMFFIASAVYANDCYVAISNRTTGVAPEDQREL